MTTTTETEIPQPEYLNGTYLVIGSARNAKRTREIGMSATKLRVTRAPKAMQITLDNHEGDQQWISLYLDQAEWLRNALTTALEDGS